MWSVLLPHCSSQFIYVGMWGTGSASHHLVGSASCSLACPVPQSATLLGPPAATFPPSSQPRLPLPPLLPVWINVSSLSPWLLDFHTVQFSVSSGCFLFLNCSCPSFGCVQRHSVSTYASILARSSRRLYFSTNLKTRARWINLSSSHWFSNFLM